MKRQREARPTVQFTTVDIGDDDQLASDVLLARVASALETSDPTGAASSLRTVTKRLGESFEQRQHVDDNLVVGTTRHLLALAEITREAEWVDRLFALHSARGFPPDSATIATLRRIVEDMNEAGSPLPTGYAAYVARLKAREADLPFAQKVLLRRLEGLRQLGL